MDAFFTQPNCDRCGKSLKSDRMMSMFNTDCLCLDCIETERKRPDYRQAVEADHAEIHKGNYNFKGITPKHAVENTTQTAPLTNIKIRLIGEDGNAIAIIAKVRDALRRSGHANLISAFTKEAMSGDYNHLLHTVLRYVDVE